MEWLILIAVCLLGGWCLFSLMAGGTDAARRDLEASPVRGCAGIVFFAVIVVIVFVRLLILGLLPGG